MTFLFAALLTIDLNLNGEGLTCETGDPPIYHPDARLIVIAGCSDQIFTDSFEE